MDSSAMIAYIWNENGAEAVKKIFKDSNNNCFIHVLNLCEVYYDLIKRAGEVEAKEALKEIYTLVTVRYDIENDVWQMAGKYKAELHRISLADCFCITLAKITGGTVVTSDHHELEKIKTLGIVPVYFIR
jgi:PIN domain nuclease of toxin-antitoxin system